VDRGISRVAPRSHWRRRPETGGGTGSVEPTVEMWSDGVLTVIRIPDATPGASDAGEDTGH
jgi:hypothetical protein